MKEFWNKKSQEELVRINSKRSESLKNKCIWVKKEGEKPFPCNIELLLSKLAEGYLIVNTTKNKEKVDIFFKEIPSFFYANKK
jgi:hypothetical protein